MTAGSLASCGASVTRAGRAGRDGLTLVELVLAFLILAVTILVMVARKNATTMSAISIHDRQVATLLADAKLGELLLEGRYLEVDYYSESGTFEDEPGFTWEFIAEKVYLQSRYAPQETGVLAPSETPPPEGTVVEEGDEAPDGTVPVIRVQLTVTYSPFSSGDADAIDTTEANGTGARTVVLVTVVTPMKIGAEAEADAAATASPSPSSSGLPNPSPGGGGG
jgi:type II secretory pathway pseudopilin PulG